MALCDNEDSPFFYSDHGRKEEHYRIFSYHYLDKDSWVLVDALEARGIMFEIDGDTLSPIRIAARPMQKFFNIGEVSFIKYGAPTYAMHKADGSLISSYRDNTGRIKTKSKNSIFSDYAILAEEVLYKEEELLNFVEDADKKGYTVNMEIVSPDPKFRIVLFYPEPALIVLNARHRETGEYMDFSLLPKKYFTGTVLLSELKTLEESKRIEGYVIIDDNNNWWKVKSPWYLERHKAKDFINRTDGFITLVLKEEADDVLVLLADQPEVLAQMEELQSRVTKKANRIINNVSEFWLYNYKLERKEYAIKGKKELSAVEFPLAMMYYSYGNEPDWGSFLVKWVKKLEW